MSIYRKEILKRLLAFTVAFTLLQLLIPIVAPYSGHDVLSIRDKISGLFNILSYIPILTCSLAIFIVIAWPLFRLPTIGSAILGASFAVLLGITFFPYDLFELNVWDETYRSLAYVAGIILLLAPWIAAWTTKQDRLG